MNGLRADLCVTDPPYNVNYEGGTEAELTIQNDSMENDLFATFLKQVFSVMYEVLKPGGSYYIFHADSEGENFRASLRKAGFKIAQCCIWVKNSMVMGRQDYQWQHEPCLYGWKPGAGHQWNSDRKQTTVWNFDKPQRNAIHPTMKPIALMAYPISNSSTSGQVVVDFSQDLGRLSWLVSRLTVYVMQWRLIRVMLPPLYIDIVLCFRNSLFSLSDKENFSLLKILNPYCHEKEFAPTSDVDKITLLGDEYVSQVRTFGALGYSPERICNLLGLRGKEK